MSAFLALNALYDRVKRSKDRDLKYIALKDIHAEITRLQQAHISTQGISDTLNKQANTINTVNQPIAPLLEQATEKKFNRLFLDCILNEGSDVSDQAAQCVALMIPVEHDETVSFVVRELVSSIIENTGTLPVELASADPDDDSVIHSVDDRMKAAHNALHIIIPAIQHTNMIYRVADETIPRCVQAIRSLNTADTVTSLLSIIMLFVDHRAHALSIMHDNLIKFFQSLLISYNNDLYIQRASVTAIATLAHSLTNQESFNILINSIIESNDRLNVSILSAIAALSPSKLGPYAPSILSCLTTLCSRSIEDAVQSSDESHIDAAEGYLLSIASLIRHLGIFVLDQQVWTSLLVLLHSALSFDPNFIGSSSDDFPVDNDGFDDNDNDYFVDNDQGDEFIDETEMYGGDSIVGVDEDSSSRVRGAACKVISSFGSMIRNLLQTADMSSFDQAIILDRRDTIKSTSSHVVLLLLDRFAERVPHIRADVGATLVDLVGVSDQCGMSLAQMVPVETLCKSIRAGLDGNQVKHKLSPGSAVAVESFYGWVETVLRSLSVDRVQNYTTEMLRHAVNVLEHSQLEGLTEAALSLAGALLSTNIVFQQMDLNSFVRLAVSALSSGVSRVVDKALASVIAILRLHERHALADSADVRTTFSITPEQLTMLHEALLIVINHASRDRSNKCAALNTIGLLYAGFPELVLKLPLPYNELHGALDVPLTRIEAAGACVCVFRVAPLIVRSPGSASAAVPESLSQITAALISFTRHADQSHQHRSLAALKELVYRVIECAVSSTGTNTSSLVALAHQLRQLVDVVRPLLSQPTDASHFADLPDLLTALILISKLQNQDTASMLLVLADVAATVSRFESLVLPTTASRLAQIFSLVSRFSSADTSVQDIQKLCFTPFVSSTTRGKELLATFAAHAVAGSRVKLDDQVEKLAVTLSGNNAPCINIEAFVGCAVRSALSSDVPTDTRVFDLLQVAALVRLELTPSNQLDAFMDMYSDSDQLPRNAVASAFAIALSCPSRDMLMKRMVDLLKESLNPRSKLGTAALVQAMQDVSSSNEPLIQLFLIDPSLLTQLFRSASTCNLDVKNVITRLLQLTHDEQHIARIVDATLACDDALLTSALLRAVALAFINAAEVGNMRAAAMLIHRLIDQLRSSSIAVGLLAVSLLVNLTINAGSSILCELEHLIDVASLVVKKDERFIEERRYGPVTRRVDTGASVRMQIFQLLQSVIVMTDFAVAFRLSSNIMNNLVQIFQIIVQDEIEVQTSACVALSAALDRFPFTVEQLVVLAETMRQVIISSLPAEAVAGQLEQHAAAVIEARKTTSKLIQLSTDPRRSVLSKDSQLDEFRALLSPVSSSNK